MKIFNFRNLRGFTLIIIGVTLTTVDYTHHHEMPYQFWRFLENNPGLEELNLISTWRSHYSVNGDHSRYAPFNLNIFPLFRLSFPGLKRLTMGEFRETITEHRQAATDFLVRHTTLEYITYPGTLETEIPSNSFPTVREFSGQTLGFCLAALPNETKERLEVLPMPHAGPEHCSILESQNNADLFPNVKRIETHFVAYLSVERTFLPLVTSLRNLQSLSLTSVLSRVFPWVCQSRSHLGCVLIPFRQEDLLSVLRTPNNLASISMKTPDASRPMIYRASTMFETVPSLKLVELRYTAQGQSRLIQSGMFDRLDGTATIAVKELAVDQGRLVSRSYRFDFRAV